MQLFHSNFIQKQKTIVYTSGSNEVGIFPVKFSNTESNWAAATINLTFIRNVKLSLFRSLEKPLTHSRRKIYYLL